MKSPGEYALDWANGATWPELVAAIRAEALHDPKQCYPCDELRVTHSCMCDWPESS